MCQCFFRLLKCIAVTINVVLLLIGLACVAIGAFAASHVAVTEIIKEVKMDLPSVESFAHVHHAEIMSAPDAHSFVEKSKEEISDIAHKAFYVLMAAGIVMSSLALLGIIAFTCCNKRNLFVMIYMILMIILVIPFIVLTAFAADGSTLRGIIFKKLDGLALSDKVEHRWFMAAVQSEMECCGVRGNVDYYCAGVYDYVCNRGCFTLQKLWREGVTISAGGKRIPMMCAQVPDVVENCKRIAPPGGPEICKKVHTPKPVDGRESDYCKENKYQNDFTTIEGSAKVNLREKLKGYNPADKNSPKDDLRVFGGEVRSNVGCGFKIWNGVNMPKYMGVAMMLFLVITLVIVFLIVVAVMSLFFNKSESTSKSKTKSESKSESKSKSTSKSKSSHS